MKDEKFRAVAVIGPTAVGKTDFGIALAEALRAEVISVDSRQVYRYLDVGTDKAPAALRRKIIHHLIDVADPDQIYSAADFARDATNAASRITARGRVPLLVGGTPFYYKALEGALSADLPKDENVRSQLEEQMATRGLSSLREELLAADPESAARIHENDPARTMRALEIFRLTGRGASWWYKRQSKTPSPFEILYIGLSRSRENLYKNIERRVKEQFANGYPEEVKWLLDNGYSPSLPALSGFGYRELARFVDGKCSLEEAELGDVRSTKAFARRQTTWFKRFNALWYDFDEISKEDALKDALPRCAKHLEGTI